MKEKLDKLFTEKIPEFPKQVQLQLPKLKKVGESDATKIQLPQLKKIENASPKIQLPKLKKVEQ
jgi:hypothetical protein